MADNDEKKFKPLNATDLQKKRLEKLMSNIVI